MAQVLALALVMLAATGHAAITRSGAFLGASDGQRMRPDVVAQTLVHVEDEWRKQAAIFTEGHASASQEAPGAFAKSCATVVSAIIQGSGGDRRVAKEYMGNVCDQKVLEGWHKLRCTALATAITDHAMNADDYANRQSLNPQKVCSGFWFVFVETEKNREAEEAKQRAEQEKVRAEEEKKAAIAAAEAKKKADAAAKVEAELRAKEEALREQEEKQQKAKLEAEEAKKRAAEAAARLAQKKAEAEKVAKEAQQKLEEAAKAEKEHQARLEEHKQAEELLRNTTKAASAPPVALKPAAKESAEKVAVAVAKPAAKPVTAEKTATAPQKANAVTKPDVATKAAVAPQKSSAVTTKDAAKATAK